MARSRRRPRRGRAGASHSERVDGKRTSRLIEYDVSEVSSWPVERLDGPPERLPSIDAINRWAAALRNEPAALDWLRDRGLSEETITYWWLGYRGGPRPSITIPLFEDGVLYNVKRRFLDGEEPKYKALGARRHELYPCMPSAKEVVLCEGEFDALVASQHGLPAVSGTAGIQAWAGKWGQTHLCRFRGRRVALCFDAGENCLAIGAELARQLQEAGAAEAWPVDLGRTGLCPGEDITDWFATYDRGVSDLCAFINDSRRACHAR